LILVTISPSGQVERREGRIEASKYLEPPSPSVDFDHPTKWFEDGKNTNSVKFSDLRVLVPNLCIVQIARTYLKRFTIKV
jgi:hypothetical protein